MKIEETEKLCLIRSDKKVKILINRAKLATKEILCKCEETLETMKNTKSLCFDGNTKWKTKEIHKQKSK